MAQGFSLHIGLNNIDTSKYKGKYQSLNNAENDTNYYYDLAVKNNFKAKKFIGEAATSNNLLDSLRTFSEQLNPGDLLFISYSGHGTRAKDLNGDEDDKWDEVLVLYDRLFVDDEFQICWARFKKGVRILFINDSCYNGSVSRIFNGFKQPSATIWAGHTLRGIDIHESETDFEQNISFYKSLKLASVSATAECSIIHIGACQDNQLADDGVATDKNGKFTLAVQKIYASGSFTGSYKSFFESVKAEMPPWQTPNWDTEAGTQNDEFERQPFLLI